jgi:hypothetical protein
MDYDKKLKKLAPMKKIWKRTKSQGCHTKEAEREIGFKPLPK